MIDTPQAQTLALEFLMADLGIPNDDHDWFSILNARLIGETWYVVEVGVEGLPDKWIIQVYDNGECDPSYTFYSPITAEVGFSDLEELPETIAAAIATERSH